MKKFATVISGFLLPTLLAMAADPLVPCGNNGPDCDWNSLFKLFNNILNWFVWAAVPIATIAIAYAGWLFIWGGTNAGNVSDGKKILKSSLIGLAAVLAAALIVKAILFYLTNDVQYQSIIQ